MFGRKSRTRSNNNTPSNHYDYCDDEEDTNESNIAQNDYKTISEDYDDDDVLRAPNVGGSRKKKRGWF